MGLDRDRVMEVFARPVNGPGRVGSGYRVTETAVLTAGHVVAGVPVRSATQVAAGDEGAGRCEVRVLGERAWVSGSVLWRGESADVALIGLAGEVPPLPPGSPVPRWGRVDGMEPVAVSAVGFPWAQERPDRVRDSEQLFGFIAPATTVKAGLCAVTVLTAAPAGRDGGSPWAGMSGAALFAGPFLVGVVVIDPARFGTDRVVAAAIAPLLADAELAGLLDVSAQDVTGVGPRLRLAVTAETSLALAPPYQPATPRMGQAPARLLPEYGIVPFAGRDGDLETLQAWCLNGTSPALRRITGAGGSGKTRLAAEACVRMTGQGWQAGFADPKAPGGRTQLDFDQPTLLVIDDADLDVPLLAGLLRAVSYWPPGTPPVRLLLLARHTTSWWDSLNKATRQLANELADPTLELHDGELTPDGCTDHHTRALTAFAAHLPDPVTPAGPVRLADPAFANPLLVHMHALLTVCGAQAPSTGEAIRERILNAVLDRERARWDATFPAGVPTGGARTRQQAVTVASLLAPPTETAAGQTMTVIAEFAPDAAAGARAAVATWLHKLYPGSDPQWVAPLRPGLLAEQLLATCAQLTDLVLAGYATMPGQAEQILTELTRAGTRPPVRGALDRLLAGHLPDLLTAAIGAPAGRLPDLLDRALQLAPQPGPAATLADQLPEHSVGLAALAATLTSQQVTCYRAGTTGEEPDAAGRLAGSLSNLSNHLGDLGRREEALAAIREAADLYRELATARPDAFRPGLATSLTILSNRLGDLGWREEALAAAREAADTYRELATAHPDAFRPGLAGSLSNLSNHLGDLGRREEALAAIREAADTYRELATADPDAFRPGLAMALTNLSGRLGELGQREEEALAAIREAADTYRQLATARPDAFRPDLAGSLSNLSVVLGDLGWREEALAAVQEAVTIDRELATARPDAFRPGLAMALNILSTGLAGLGRREEALAAIREAVTIDRELATARPDAFRPDLAMALNKLSVRLADLDRPKSALAAIREAADLYRELATARPDAFRPGLAASLTNLSVRLDGLGRREEALAAIREAADLYRELATARPDAFRPGLAASLTNLSVRLDGLGRREEALAAIREAADLYRELATARPDAFRPGLAMALTNLSARLAGLGRRKDALAAIREAVTIRRKLAARWPDAYQHDLEMSLQLVARLE